MNSKLILSFSLLLIISCTSEMNNHKEIMNNYPDTRVGNDSAIYFNTTVKDPYFWLEDDRSEETENWVKNQNKYTFSNLNKLENRDQIRKRFSDLWNYEKMGQPFIEGEHTYFYKNDGLQNQYVIYRSKKNSAIETFLDPNTFSKDGTTSLGNLSFSESGKVVAYSISEGGSDWRKVIIMDADSKEILEDTLVDIKFSGLSWKGDEGFYYSSYDKPDGSELSAKTDQHKLFFHKLDTKQSDDLLIYGGDSAQKRRYISSYISEDNKYLFISGAKSTSGNELLYIDINDPTQTLISIVDHFENDSYVLDHKDSKFYIVTNIDAPNKKIITVDVNNPQPENWVDFIPESKNVLNPSIGGGFIFANYMIDAVSTVEQYEYSGKFLNKVELPGIGTVNGFSGKKGDHIIYYSFNNYHTPSSIYAYHADEFHSEIYWSPKIDFEQDLYESKQVFYKSKDGTEIPMIISYKKGLELNGENPTILYGYGGFNISLTPSFSIGNAIWMEQGGVYAVPNLRGGGEYGKEWHDAGTQLNKQNVFDDFIAAAEFLIDSKYTSSDKLAIRGRSNGGLLVGAVMSQRPKLMKVALPGVGVLDMLKYHTFTAGAGWAYDYGTSEQSKEMFEYLLGYSPVHNIKTGVEYPATLVTTGDHDDRVVPAHSFKFISELQAKQSGTNPVLIRIETDGGHGAGTPISKQIDAHVDEMSFLLHHLGVKNWVAVSGEE